jgi:hydrogenase maturation protease
MECKDSGGRIELLVIGYGNSLRGDDAVGPRVAEAIESLKLQGTRTLSCTLLTPELAATISRARKVVFVDATVESAAEVELRKLLPAKSSQVFGHSANPVTLLAIAQDLFGHAPEAWSLAIPVENMDMGEQLSALAKRGVAVAVEKIEEMPQ